MIFHDRITEKEIRVPIRDQLYTLTVLRADRREKIKEGDSSPTDLGLASQDTCVKVAASEYSGGV